MVLPAEMSLGGRWDVCGGGRAHTQSLKRAAVAQTEEEGSLKSSCSLVFGQNLCFVVGLTTSSTFIAGMGQAE